MARCGGCNKKFDAGEQAVEAATHYLFCADCVLDVVVYGVGEEDKPVVLPVIALSFPVS